MHYAHLGYIMQMQCYTILCNTKNDYAIQINKEKTLLNIEHLIPENLHLFFTKTISRHCINYFILAFFLYPWPMGDSPGELSEELVT